MVISRVNTRAPRQPGLHCVRRATPCAPCALPAALLDQKRYRGGVGRRGEEGLPSASSDPDLARRGSACWCRQGGGWGLHEPARSAKQQRHRVMRQSQAPWGRQTRGGPSETALLSTRGLCLGCPWAVPRG